MNSAKVQQQIRALMKRKGLSHTEVALRMGIDRVTFTQYLGPRRNLTLSTVEKIARALECEVRVLLRPLKGAG